MKTQTNNQTGLTASDVVNNIIQHGIDGLDSIGEVYGCDLHNELFNRDYYIIGTYAAKQELNAYDVFDAIEKVIEYEKSNFGEVTTEINNPERLVNMLAYIIGEEVLSECKTLTDNWDNLLTTEDIAAIKEELKAQL
jgi:hypothetical protein